MAFEFKLPDIGEGVVEGEIVKWLVKPGDVITVDQPMVEVMTDKATVVIPSPKAGKVLETRGAEGAIARVHSVIVVIDDGVAAKPAPVSVAPPAPVAPVAPVVQAAPVAPVAPVAVQAAPVVVAPPPPPVSVAPTSEKVLAAPATRRLARELGVDLQRVAGSGPAGRVTSEDVRRAQQAPAAPVAVEAPRPATKTVAPKVLEPTDERIAIRGLRKRIFDNMTTSAFTAAHFTFVEECDCTQLVGTRGRLNELLKSGETSLTYLPFIIKAVVTALRRFPMLNGHVDDDALEFIKRSYFHIGVAVASERGLIVPVVRNADRRSLVNLAQEIKRLSDAVRSNSLTSDDLGGSTFTITSLGKEGGIFATPIINYPEVAIMGVHKMSKRPVVVDDQIVAREMMNLSLSFDHRLIDGHVGAAFTYAVIELLQNPDRLLMEMS